VQRQQRDLQAHGVERQVVLLVLQPVVLPVLECALCGGEAQAPRVSSERRAVGAGQGGVQRTVAVGAERAQEVRRKFSASRGRPVALGRKGELNNSEGTFITRDFVPRRSNRARGVWQLMATTIYQHLKGKQRWSRDGEQTYACIVLLLPSVSYWKLFEVSQTGSDHDQAFRAR
jgi:hypothetical protein